MEEEFSKRLKRVREANMWNKKIIANKLQVPYQTWVGWEKGMTTPPLYTQILLFEKIARVARGEV